MYDYEQWNTAIIDYFTGEVPKGTPVYLTVNEETLKYIGNKYFNINEGSSVEEFERAIKKKCTQGENAQKRVCLGTIHGYDGEGYPLGIAFLSAMVLAAHKMSGEGDIDPANYLLRLCGLLEVVPNPQGNRPTGMERNKNEGDERAVEVSLWRFWNVWLETNGWGSTAEQLPTGPLKYLNYTIEQALLRDDDVTYLRNKFKRSLSNHRSLDEAQLGGWMKRENLTRKHLRRGLESGDLGRVSAFLDAAYRVYATMNWDSDADETISSITGSRGLNAGIQRIVSRKGEVAYWMLPRRPTQWKAVGLEVLNPQTNTYQKLEHYRADLFRPTWSINPFIDATEAFNIKGDVGFDQLFFPSREFWILTEEQDDPTKTLATWEKYPTLLGKRFMLLLKGDINSMLSQELKRYKEQNLIEWDGTPKEDDRGWTEYKGCMILSRSWDCIIPIDSASRLFDALKPSSSEFATLSLSGGLKVSAQNAWLEGFPPLVCIYGFEKDFKLLVTSGQIMIDELEVEVQKPYQLPLCSSTGLYQLEVRWGAKIVANRTLRIISWDQLEPSNIDSNTWVKTKSARLRGPWIETLEAKHV